MSMNDERLAADIAATSPFEVIIEKLKQQARDGWKGQTGDERAVQLDRFIRETVAEYATVLGMSELDVLAAIEARRDYTAVNYYQRANFPALDGVRVFETREAFSDAIPSRRFRCPACGGVSTDYQSCNSDIVLDGNTCNWKAFGFLRTLGKGASIVIKSDFLTNGRVHEIFMPLEFEEPAAATA